MDKFKDIKYAILRQLIRKYYETEKKGGNQMSFERIYDVSLELEGKTLEELKEIYKREIGCCYE